MDNLMVESDFVNKLLFGNCIEVLKRFPQGSVTSVVCDPPYGLEFMGKEWDAPWKSDKQPATGLAHQLRGYQEWCREWGCEVIRVLKPGGHILSFGGTRMYHRMVCGIEDAGFQVRDQIDFACELETCHDWAYASGFPKSMNISKQLDKMAGAEREVIGVKPGHEEFVGRATKGHIDFKDGTEGFDRPWMHDDDKRKAYHLSTAPATEEAKRWDGYGTALKPAHEPIAVFGDGTASLNRESPLSYVNKASRKERNLGCGDLHWLMENGKHVRITKDDHDRLKAEGKTVSQGNIWPTVKPLELMRYLVRMVKMPGRNIILDPFMGSGTTPMACIMEGCGYVGIENDEVAFAIAEARVEWAKRRK